MLTDTRHPRATTFCNLLMAFLHVGVDILCLFPLVLGQVKFLLVVVDYFTKWIEVESVASISAKRVRRFYWKKIILIDNSTQFVARSVIEFCVQCGTKQAFTSIEHPQSNEQVEVVNRVILRGLRKWLEEAKGR
ncbi:hypothetical protein CR513_21392, partial [Mucuna pruriens]